MLILTIKCDAPKGDFTVLYEADGDEPRWMDHLTQDEALWVTAQFLMGNVHGYLRCSAEHENWRQRLAGFTSEQSGETESTDVGSDENTAKKSPTGRNSLPATAAELDNLLSRMV